MEHTMLAELFMMRLETTLRSSKEAPDRTSSRFVRFEHAAEGALKQSKPSLPTDAAEKNGQ